MKDMYADLEKIEARGKRKKEKSKGFFSSFGKDDEPEPDVAQSNEPVETPKPAPPVKEPMFSKSKEVPKVEPPKPQPAPVPEPKKVEVATPPPVKSIVQEPTPTKPVNARPPEPTQAEPQPKPSWKPLTGSKLNNAEEHLHVYKKWLNKGYKSGVLTKEQCTEMVKSKEIELGLRPPE